MDEYLLQLVNGLAGQSAKQDAFVRSLQLDYFKTVPIILLFWAMWFRLPERRDALLALLLVTLPLMAGTRIVAMLLPFRPRPMYDPGFDHTPAADVPFHTALENWSAMPSDHAALFFALSAGMWMISRPFGALAVLHTVLVICLPRLYLAYHWPSDILVGGLLGVAVVVFLLGPLTRLIAWTRIVPFFEVREWLGYPLLFVATYELSTMFNGLRNFAGALVGIEM